MSTSIDPGTHLERLRIALGKSIEKPSRKDGRANTSTVVVTETAAYYAGSVASDSGILDCPSEEVALSMAVHANDFGIKAVITLSSVDPPDVSPLVLKILADHAARIGRSFGYSIHSNEGRELFSGDSHGLLPFYRSPSSPLAKAGTAPMPNTMLLDAIPEDIAPILKEAALLGITRNFPNYDSASGYGASVLTEDGTVYFGGQYSTPEKRLGMHSEMAVTVGCIMNQASPIRALGLVSSKHENSPCSMCGCCKQFLLELCEKAGIDPVLHFFAKSTDEVRKYRLEELHADPWSSTRA